MKGFKLSGYVMNKSFYLGMGPFCYRVLSPSRERTKKLFRFLSCVPKHDAVRESDVESLAGFLENSGRILALTGAGVSTESGIPDYRSEEVGLYATSKTRPVLFKDFLDRESVRRRYWARNYIGWPRFSSTVPNVAHVCLTNLQDSCTIGVIITQNVDNLHTKAGSQDVIELHGSAYRVVCIDCAYKTSRHSFQEVLENMNPYFSSKASKVNPDGDAEITEITKHFNLPSCPQCGGILKPDIVFFGDNVPKDRVNLIRDKVAECDSLVVFGSSLTVFSSYRIVVQASELKKRIAIVNIGQTRGDDLCDIKLSVRCGEILTKYCSLKTQ